MSSTASMAKSSFLVSLIISARTATPYPGLLRRLSPRKRIGTSGLDAGRAEPGLLAAFPSRKRWHDHEIRSRNAGKNELRDTVSRLDLDCLTAMDGVAVPCRDQAGPLVIGIDDADRIAENQPAIMAEPGTRHHKGAPFGVGDAKGDTRRDQDRGGLRLQKKRPVKTGVEIEPGRETRSAARKTPPAQPRIEKLELYLHDSRNCRCSSILAIRSARRVATSRLVITGQSSTAAASTRWIVLRSPPKVSVPGETSLARIQSQRLRASLRRAFSTTSSVSAANPMTRAGRSLLRCAMRERMSGFSANRRTGGPSTPFFSLWDAAHSIRQSATAAAMTATSTGSAASQAASISAAVSIATTSTPSGEGSCVGPETSTVSAPSAAKAAAIACPCLPEEWFDM